MEGEEEEETKGQSSFQKLMASMKVKANEASKALTVTVESVFESYLTKNVAKRYLTPHSTSTNVERLFSTASNVLDGRNLNTENLEKLVFLKENLKLKLRTFALDL